MPQSGITQTHPVCMKPHRKNGYLRARKSSSKDELEIACHRKIFLAQVIRLVACPAGIGCDSGDFLPLSFRLVQSHGRNSPWFRMELRENFGRTRPGAVGPFGEGVKVMY